MLESIKKNRQNLIYVNARRYVNIQRRHHLMSCFEFRLHWYGEKIVKNWCAFTKEQKVEIAARWKMKTRILFLKYLVIYSWIDFAWSGTRSVFVALLSQDPDFSLRPPKLVYITSFKHLSLITLLAHTYHLTNDIYLKTYSVLTQPHSISICGRPLANG